MPRFSLRPRETIYSFGARDYLARRIRLREGMGKIKLASVYAATSQFTEVVYAVPK